jgi:ADP-dependent NAD(P)H-hydrate dehydratase / NAD(P)H-hydrate epimerase
LASGPLVRRDHLASLVVQSFPDWLTLLPDAAAMRAVDRWAVEQRGVPSLDLMERAGAGVARAVERLVADGPVAVVCGKGNNGGDGLVVARLLRDAGRDVEVVCVASPRELTGDARANLDRLPGDGPIGLSGGAWAGGDEEQPPGPAAAKPLAGAAVIVDALLGTGFEGEPRGAVAQAIDAIGAARAPVVSVDVPSGVDASTGEVAGSAVRATATVTFHAGKPGLWIHPGKAHAGDVETLDIGIPRGAPGISRGGAPAGISRGAPAPAPAGDELAGSAAGGADRGEAQAPTVGLVDRSVLDVLPRRGAVSTKFSSGHVLVAGGSRGLTGAPCMAAQAAMRAGAGYVTACVPATLQAILASGAPPELMTRGLAEDEGGLAPAGVADVLDAAERGGALALGPGLGRTSGAVAFARALAREARVALVLDADGLNAHAGRLRDLRSRDAPTVLTPHAGELARLLELDGAEIERARLRHVRTAAEQAGAVVVLKGDDTLIAHPSGPVAVSPGNSPALATAGTGDVLAGTIAALLAQGLDAFTAAAAGVFLHAAAGREAARRQGAAEGVVATDVIAALPAARTETPAARTETAGGRAPLTDGSRGVAVAGT